LQSEPAELERRDLIVTLRDQVELKFGADLTPLRVSLPSAALNAESVTLAGSRFDYATTGKTHYLALHDIMMRDGELRVDRRDPVRQTDIRRRITFIPAGVPVSGWTDPLERRNSFVAIHFDLAAIPELLGRSAAFEDPAVYFQDRSLCQTLTKLDTAMSSDQPLIELLAESLCDTAIIEFGIWHARGARLPRRSPALAAAQIARVREYIAANLAAPVTLTDLSAITGLSKFHFCRAFKAATGISPYQEVLKTRLAIARRMIDEGRDLADAAGQTGFTGTAQLSRSLRQHREA
tara:strand:- start:3612 stop:4490 length:879 start_codon:yes stop_codon:yes gene_type:complete